MAATTLWHLPLASSLTSSLSNSHDTTRAHNRHIHFFRVSRVHNPPFSLNFRAGASKNKVTKKVEEEEEEEEEEEVDEENEGAEEEEEDESWVDVKVEQVRELTEGVLAAVPGPRVGGMGLPWLVAVPLAYMAVTFLIAVVKTIQKRNTPKFKRRKQVGKNAQMMEALDAFFPAATSTFTSKDLANIQRQFGFGAEDVLRKYIRYCLNEKPFSPDVVGALIHLRRVALLDDEAVVAVLNDISRRTVKAKGPVVMDTAGFTGKGIQRKAAVQALFSKLLYLAELEDFVAPSARDKLEIKSIFGVTDEDAESIKITSLSSAEDMDLLDKSLEGEASDDGEQ